MNISQRQQARLDNIRTLVANADRSTVLDRFKRHKILSYTGNAKTQKSNKTGITRTGTVSFLPADYSGINVCQNHKYCKIGCLGVNSGQNYQDIPILSKFFTTMFFHYHRDLFLRQLHTELNQFEAVCNRQNVLPSVRLNTYSDNLWEVIDSTIFTEHQDIQFYDYSKVYSRRFRAMPSNYDITYSLIARVHNADHIRRWSSYIIENGINARLSVVLAKPLFQAYFSGLSEDDYIERNGIKYVNGLHHDITFGQPIGSVIVLEEKSVTKIDQLNLNPLVYQDIKDIGL